MLQETVAKISGNIEELQQRKAHEGEKMRTHTAELEELQEGCAISAQTLRPAEPSITLSHQHASAVQCSSVR